MFRTLGWCLAMAVVLGGCSLPTTLNEDGYDAKKYDLPPVLHAGASKAITVSGGAGWAFVPVTKNTYYEISVTGSSTGTLTVYHADKTTAYVTGSAGTAQGFIASATENAFVKLSQPGTGSSSATLSCVTYPVLTSGVWQGGSISDTSDGAPISCWYAFPVTAGTSYDFNMNNAYDGDGSHSAATEATVYGGDRTTVVASVGQSDYASPATFTPSVTGIVFIEVDLPYYYDNGTFAVRVQPTAPPTALSSGIWCSGTIADNRTLWYAFPVTAGHLYDFNMNNAYGGDGSETGRTSATIFHADKVTSYASNIISAYSTSTNFKAAATETVYICITNYYGGGTFALRMQETVFTSLVAGVWQNDTLSSVSHYYSFPVVAGTLYDLRINNASQGDGSKNGSTQASIVSSDWTTTYASQVAYDYSSPTEFVATTTGTVYVNVSKYNSSIGTFAVLMEATPVAVLNAGSWQNGTIASSNSLWYSFTADGSTQYRLNLNGALYGDFTKTAYVQATVFKGNAQTVMASSLTSIYTNPYMFTPQAGTVYVCVTVYGGSGGTFAIKYQ